MYAPPPFQGFGTRAHGRSQAQGAQALGPAVPFDLGPTVN